MSNTSKIITGIVVILLIIWGVLASRDSQKSEVGKSGEVIKIGAVLGLTGPAATWGDMSKKGIDLAVKEVNDAGGINGKKIEVVYEDSQTNPAKGVSAFNKLVSVDGVSIIFGDVWNFITNPLISLAESKRVTLLSPTVMDVGVEKTSPYFYTVGHTIESQKRAIEKFFEVNKDIKTVSVLFWNDQWGTANRDLFLSVAKARGIKVLSTEGTSDFSATYQAEITKIKAGNPDAIYFNSSLPDVVLRKIKDLGLGDKKVLALSTTRDAIEVTKTPVAYLKNVYFTDWVPSREFIEKFKSTYGVSPITETQNSYDMVRAVVMALQSGGELPASLNVIKFTSSEGYPIDFTKSDQIRVNEGQADLYQYDGNYVQVK